MDAVPIVGTPFARVSPAYGGKTQIVVGEEVNEGDFTLTIGSVKLMLKDKTKPEYQTMQFKLSTASITTNWGQQGSGTNETIREINSSLFEEIDPPSTVEI